MGVRWQKNGKVERTEETSDKMIRREAWESIDKCIFIQQLLSSTYSYMKKELDSTDRELEEAKITLEQITQRLRDRKTQMSEIKLQMEDFQPTDGKNHTESTPL